MRKREIEKACKEEKKNISVRSTRARSRTPSCTNKSVKFLASYQSSASVLVRLYFFVILGGQALMRREGRTRVLISLSFPCLPFTPSLVYAVPRRPGTLLSERGRQGVLDA